LFKNYNSHEFNEDLKYNFENFDFDTSDPNKMWESWKNIFNMVHAPTRIRKVRSEYAPWLTSNIKKSMYHRDYLKKMAIKHNSLIITKHLRHKGTKSTKL
jgi:hypothetical protein